MAEKIFLRSDWLGLQRTPCTTGIGTLSVTNPIWVVKTRLCLQYTNPRAGISQAPQYKGMLGEYMYWALCGNHGLLIIENKGQELPQCIIEKVPVLHFQVCVDISTCILKAVIVFFFFFLHSDLMVEVFFVVDTKSKTLHRVCGRETWMFTCTCRPIISINYLIFVLKVIFPWEIKLFQCPKSEIGIILIMVLTL